jgi:hypothetical protein
MGRKLIEGVIPDIARQLERIADALESKEIRTENALTNLIKQFPNDQELGKEIRQRWKNK